MSNFLSFPYPFSYFYIKDKQHILAIKLLLT